MAGALDILHREHDAILRMLDTTEEVAQLLLEGKPVAPEILTGLLEFFQLFADRCHHSKEEQHLFPALERHGVPREGGPVGVMLHEHETGRGLLRVMAEGADREVAEAIRAYGSLLRAHISKENEILFPIAEQVLAEEEQRAIVQAFDALEQVVVGPGIHEQLLAKLAELEGR